MHIVVIFSIIIILAITWMALVKLRRKLALYRQLTKDLNRSVKLRVIIIKHRNAEIRKLKARIKRLNELNCSLIAKNMNKM